MRVGHTVTMDTALIICIGNVARGDDGVAHHVARRLSELTLPAEVRVVTATDLDVAMAEEVASAGLVLIVDAVRRAFPPVTVEALSPGPAVRPTGHTIDAPSLLALAEALYGRAPAATLVAVAAPEMGHTEALSATAEAASLEAASVIAALLDTPHTS